MPATAEEQQLLLHATCAEDLSSWREYLATALQTSVLKSVRDYSGQKAIGSLKL
jgi:hypothetical protein